MSSPCLNKVITRRKPGGSSRYRDKAFDSVEYRSKKRCSVKQTKRYKLSEITLKNSPTAVETEKASSRRSVMCGGNKNFNYKVILTFDTFCFLHSV